MGCLLNRSHSLGCLPKECEAEDNAYFMERHDRGCSEAYASSMANMNCKLFIYLQTGISQSVAADWNALIRRQRQPQAAAT